MNVLQAEPVGNPFSTRHVRPGALPYLFDEGQSAEAILERLAHRGWRGQIVGPHGSGKSTLLAALIARLEREGLKACLFSLHDGQRRLIRHWARLVRRSGAKLIVIDGFEQLGCIERAWIDVACRARGWGLLVTTHDQVKLPVIFRAEPSLDTALAIVERLLGVDDSRAIRQVVEECFAAAGGNLREMLFALYDRYERGQAGSTPRGR